MPYIAFMTVTKGCSEKLYAQNNSVELYKADRRTSDISFDEFFLLPQKNNLSATCPIWVRHLRSGKYSCKAAIDLSFLQSLSYKLCHLFYHSKSVVRQPAPVVVKTLLNVFIACSFSLPLSTVCPQIGRFCHQFSGIWHCHWSRHKAEGKTFLHLKKRDV